MLKLREKFKDDQSFINYLIKIINLQVKEIDRLTDLVREERKQKEK